MLVDERARQEAETKAKEDADAKNAKEASDKKLADEAKAKELESIPEAFRGKSTKELVDMALSQAAEVERIRKETEDLRGKIPKTREEELSPEERKSAQERAFFADPIGFLEKHVANRTKPLVEANLDVQARVQKETARSYINKEEGAGEFEKYEKRVDEIMATLPPDVKANPNAYIGVYNIAVGEETITKRKEARKTAGLHSETGGEGGVGGEATKKKPKVLEDLDDAAIDRVAAKFGMTKEQAYEWSEKYEG